MKIKTEWIVCPDGRKLPHIRTETKQQDGYEQTFEVYGCPACQVCFHHLRL